MHSVSVVSFVSVTYRRRSHHTYKCIIFRRKRTNNNPQTSLYIISLGNLHWYSEIVAIYVTTDTQTKQLDEHRNLYLNLDCNKHSRQKRSNQSSCKQDYCKLIIRGRQRNNSLGQLFESYDLFLRD